ncbi:uncharacterized protein PG986_004338 [Apiospora aurea]|uniref:Ubiquitin-like domain-containing protein n=1 Tax=Apiospora aurea TaxID=335848 RepID=A0ABR1QNW5_9PEZI
MHRSQRLRVVVSTSVIQLATLFHSRRPISEHGGKNCAIQRPIHEMATSKGSWDDCIGTPIYILRNGKYLTGDSSLTTPVIARWSLGYCRVRRGVGQCQGIPGSAQGLGHLHPHPGASEETSGPQPSLPIADSASTTQIVEENRQFESCPSLANLSIETKSIVNECATLIQNALDRWFPKYQQNLQPGGSGSSVKDAFRKIEWSLREKQGIQELQDKLRKNTERLALIIGITSRYVSRAENASVLANIDEVKTLASENQTNQQILQKALRLQSRGNQAMHSDLSKRHEVQATGLMSIVAILIAVFHQIGHVRALIVAIMSRLQMITTSPLLQGLDPTKGLPVYLEDALGEIRELPLQWVTDWDDVDTLLEMWFKNRKGYQLVKSPFFALEDDCSGQDIDRGLPPNTCLRRGGLEVAVLDAVRR